MIDRAGTAGHALGAFRCAGDEQGEREPDAEGPKGFVNRSFWFPFPFPLPFPFPFPFPFPLPFPFPFPFPLPFLRPFPFPMP